MAFTSGTNWDVQTGGDSTNNGGGFDTGVSGFPTDGAATSATGTSPVFTSASYSFVAGDVGAYIYINSGSNWTVGRYKIASVATGAATLTAPKGCAATASPTGATWGIDYSQSTTARISFTDLVIDGTTNTKFTSSANPVGKNFIGNIIAITAGTGWTVQRVAIVSTSGTTATCDKSLGTLSSTGGTGGLGGAVASPTVVASAMTSGNTLWLKTGTYTITSQIAISGSNPWSLFGYGSEHNDWGSPPTITTATNSINLINVGNATFTAGNLIFTTTAATKGNAINAVLGGTLRITGVTITGFVNGISSASGTNVLLWDSTITGCSGSAVTTSGGSHSFSNCTITNNTGVQVTATAANALSISYCRITGGGAAGVFINGGGQVDIKNSTIAQNTGNGTSVNGGNITGSVQLISSIIQGNGGLGLGASGSTVTPAWGYYGRNNAWGGNTSGDYGVALPAGAGDVTLTVDPFTNAAGGDFSLNSTAGGGALCKGAGYPANLDIGAVQSASSGGGSSSSGNYGFIG